MIQREKEHHAMDRRAFIWNAATLAGAGLGARLTKGAKQPNDWEQGWNGYGLTLLIDVMASLLVVPESLGLSVFISECP